MTERGKAESFRCKGYCSLMRAFQKPIFLFCDFKYRWALDSMEKNSKIDRQSTKMLELK